MSQLMTVVGEETPRVRLRVRAGSNAPGRCAGRILPCALSRSPGGRRIFAALTPAGVTEVLVLAVIRGEAVFGEIVASAVAASDDLGNHFSP